MHSIAVLSAAAAAAGDRHAAIKRSAASSLRGALGGERRPDHFWWLRQAPSALPQPLDVDDRDDLAAEQRDLLLAQAAQRAVDMHEREAEMVGHLLLRQRQLVARPADQSAAAQPVMEVEQQDGKPRRRIEPAD